MMKGTLAYFLMVIKKALMSIFEKITSPCAMLKQMEISLFEIGWIFEGSL